MGSARRTAVGVAVTVAVATAVLAAGGCGASGGSGGPGGSDGSGGSSGSGAVGGGSAQGAGGSGTAGKRYASVDSPLMAFRLRLAADEKLAHEAPKATASGTPSATGPAGDGTAGPGASATPRCGTSPADSAELERNGTYLVTFEVDPPRCGPARSVWGNGRRAPFHSVDDLTTEQWEDAHGFPIARGTVVTFEQRYFECTNSCRHWDEPVALVRPDFPADPDYPTLVVRSNRAVLDRDDLEHLVADQLSLPAPASPVQSPSPSRSGPPS